MQRPTLKLQNVWRRLGANSMEMLKIQIGGSNFRKNLAIVKSCDRARYQPATKLWHVPDTIENLKKLVDIASIRPLILKRIEDLEIDIEREILRATVTPEDAFKLKEDYPFLFDYQCVAAHFIIERKKFLIADEMGCVTGDTVISVNRGGITRKYTVDTVYKRTHDTGRYAWNTSIHTYVRCLKDDRFGLNRMVKIVDKGIKNVIKITTESGKHITLTPDHPILTPSGFVESGVLNIGDEIVCNGHDATRYVHNSDGYVYLRGKSLWNHPRYTTSGLLEHVYVMETHLGRYITREEEIHHINGIRNDNRIENLQLVTRSEHKKLHHAYTRFKDFTHQSGSEVITLPKCEKIISIESVDEQRVYDIMMLHPYHNFVANGIVVKNCGKTIECMPFIDRMFKDGKKILILCPSSISHQWASEIERFISLPSTNIVGLLKDKRLTEYRKGKRIIISTYESFKNDLVSLKAFGYDFSDMCVIADEASKFKNRKTKVYKELHSISPQFHGFIALTGTPIENELENFFNIVSIIDPNFMTRTQFERDYCVYTGSGVYEKCTGYRNLKDFINRVTKIMIRRTKNDVTELPPAKIHNRIIPMTKEQKICTDAIRKYSSQTGNMGCVTLLREVANDTTLLNADTSTVVQEMQHLKLLPTIIPKGSNKIPECLSIMEEVGNEQVIIFTMFSQMAVKLGAELIKKGYKIKILTGNNSIPERAAEVEKFKNNEYQILIATDIFGYGVNLQFCHNMINFDIPWNPAKLNQRIGRIHRQGSDHDKTIINLLSEDIDEHVYEVIVGKQDLFDQVVEGKAIDDEAVRKQILQKLVGE